MKKESRKRKNRAFACVFCFRCLFEQPWADVIAARAGAASRGVGRRNLRQLQICGVIVVGYLFATRSQSRADVMGECLSFEGEHWKGHVWHHALADTVLDRVFLFHVCGSIIYSLCLQSCSLAIRTCLIPEYR